MTYQLTNEEMDQLRDLVRLLYSCSTYSCGSGMLSASEQVEAIRIAERIQEWIR